MTRPFQRLLRQSHTRRLAWRTIEFAAIGLLLACAQAAVLLPLHWWRGVDALPLVATLLAIGIVGGAIVALSRRPTLLNTARLVESHLNAPELLSSAWLESSRDTHASDADFVATLFNLADARVANLSPSSIVMRRLGSRAWSGVGLAAAGVVVAALMVSPAATDSRTAVAALSNFDARLESTRPPQTRHADPNNDPASRDPRSAGDRNSDTVDTGSGVKAGDDDAAESRTTRAGTGSGASSSPDLRSNTTPHDASARNSSSKDGTQPAGGSGAFDGVTAAERRDVAGTAGVAEVPPSPPWASDRWPAAREAAMQSIRNGRVPDQYRSLVQEYFDR